MSEFEKLCSPEIQRLAKKLRMAIKTFTFDELADLQEVLRNLSEEALVEMQESDPDNDPELHLAIADR